MNPPSRTPARGCSSRDGSGFTRSDLLVLLAISSLLGLLAWPVLAQPRARSLEALCAGNLREIGHAMVLWGNDHQEVMPWRVPVAEGGTMISPRSGNGWFELGAISNYLASPRLFVCPADPETTKMARNFSRSADGGFFHASFRNNALSYFVGLDAGPAEADSWVCGDRNLRVDFVNVSCSSGVNNAAAIYYRDGFGLLAWTNGVHQLKGNMLHHDGHVSLSNTEQLRSSLQIDDNASIHILMPR